MPDDKLVPIRLQVALHHYVKVETPRKMYTKLGTIFGSCFLPARWQQQQLDGLCCVGL
jgi:hypothetical protein